MERLAKFMFVCACVFTCAICHASAVDNLKLLKNLHNKMLLLDMISRLSVLSEYNATKCYQDLIYLQESLMLYKLWAIKMVDASSKLQSGILEGNIADLGQYDECIDVLQRDTNSTFQGQHCLIGVSLPLGGSSLANNLGVAGVQAVVPNKLTLTMSSCLPSSCSPAELKQMYENLLTLALKFSAGMTPQEVNNLTLTVDVSDCHIRTTTSLSVSERIALGIFLLLVILVVNATVYDYVHKTYFSQEGTSLRDEVISCFSLLTNVKRLFSGSVSAETMPAINGLKALSIAWVVLGHRLRYSADLPVLNLLRMTDYIKCWYSMIILNATLSVDVFFLISGVLNAYSFLKVGGRRRKPISACGMNYIHRYLRLTPAYALMIFMTATWVYRLGDGPIWDWLAAKAKEDCVNNWWSNLIYINNYYSPDNMCMMQSWYLAADMQMFWLSPLLLYPLLKWPLFGVAEGGVLCVVSIFVPFYVAFVNNIATPIPLSEDGARVNREMDTLYLPTHTKTVSYVIGVLTGFIIHRIRYEKTNFAIHKVMAGLTWLAAVVCLLGSLFGGYWIYQFEHPYNKWESSLYIGFYRFFWSMGLAWIIFACTTGYGGIVNSFLSLRAFTILGRLTYCIYLVHVAVLVYNIGSMRVPPYFSVYGQICLFFGDLAISVVLAALLNLTIESPLMALENIVFGRRSTRSRHESR